MIRDSIRFTLYKGILVSFFLLCGTLQGALAANVSANIDEVVLKSGSALPRGYQRALVCSFKLTSDDTDVKINQVEIGNTGPVNFNSSGIRQVELVVVEDGQERQLGDPKDFDSGTNTWLFSFGAVTFDDVDEQKEFRIYYTVADDASLEATANFTLKRIAYGAATVNISSIASLSKNFVISGVEVILGDSYVPDVVVPNSYKVPYAYMNIVPIGESFTGAFSMTIHNEADNFDAGNTESGITAVRIYEDDGPQVGIFEEDDDTYIIGVWDEKISDVTDITITGNLKPMSQGATKNYFIVFDIGSKTTVGDGAKINFQLQSFSVRGSNSALTVRMIDRQPSNPEDNRYTTLIGGLRLDDLVSIVPTGNIDRSEDVLPMAWFSLSAHELALTMNSLTLTNNARIPFVTSVYDNTGVKKVYLFHDDDGDRFFKGLENETLIAIWELGNPASTYEAPNEPTKIKLTELGIPIPMTHYVQGDPDPVVQKKSFFVVYSLGSSVSATPSPTTVALNVTGALATSSATMYEVGLSGATPSKTVTAKVWDTNVRIYDVTYNAPALVYQYSEDVPVVSYKLTSECDLENVMVVLYSSGGGFYNDGSGVSAVKLYLDMNNNGIIDGTDVLKGIITDFDDELRVQLPPVKLRSQTIQQFLVAASFGYNARQSINFQIDGIVSTASLTTIVPAGLFPNPYIPLQVPVSENRVTITRIQATSSVVERSSTEYLISMGVVNGSASDLSIIDAGPKFYKDNIQGADVSYEYAVTPVAPASFPVTLSAGSSVTLSFRVNTALIRTSGSLVLDGYCRYRLPGITHNVSISRHKGVSGTLAAASVSPGLWEVYIGADAHFAYPAYIQDVRVCGTTANVYDGDVLPRNASLVIQLANQGSEIRGDSLRVSLNATALATDTSSANYFVYDDQNGVLTIHSVGNKQGVLTVQACDILGNRLEEFTFRFLVNDVTGIEIEDLLVYPSPFKPAVTDLRIGFNLTGQADVTFYLVNILGNVVWSTDVSYNTYGYKQFTFNGIGDDGKYIPSGVYVLYVVAENDRGKRARAKTKFAVW